MVPMRHQKVRYLTLVFRGVFSVCCIFDGMFDVVIDMATNEVINIMFVGATRASKIILNDI